MAKELEALLNRYPREQLTRTPTPLDHLPNLSGRLGPEARFGRHKAVRRKALEAFIEQQFDSPEDTGQGAEPGATADQTSSTGATRKPAESASAPSKPSTAARSS